LNWRFLIGNAQVAIYHPFQSQNVLIPGSVFSMFCSLGHLRLLVLVTVAAVSAPACACAAWLGYKNNTNAIVVIQAADIVVVNGQVKQIRPGKAHSLYPGEVAWDPIAAPGPRMIGIYDPKQNNKLVYQDRIDCGKNDIFLSLQIVQPPPVKGVPRPAQLVLLPIVLPAQAPGVMPPGSMPPNRTPPGTAKPNPKPPGTTPPPGATPGTTLPPASPSNPPGRLPSQPSTPPRPPGR